MKTFLRLTLGSALCLLLSACEATSENPLSSPESAKPDPKLIGIWHEKGVTDETLEFTAKGAHWMHLVDRKQDKEPEEYDMFVTAIDGSTFLNIVETGDGAIDSKRGYFLVRYKVSGKKLSTWWLDLDQAANAVRSGQLKGVVRQKPKSTKMGSPAHPDFDVTLQDSSANMEKFIRQHGTKSLFSTSGSELFRAGSN